MAIYSDFVNCLIFHVLKIAIIFITDIFQRWQEKIAQTRFVIEVEVEA